jgi:predicted  nucleic acid-binding Zn-ribbon protein
VTPQSSDFPYCRSEATEREWAFFRALVQARVERDAANKIIYVTCPKCGHRQKSPALVLNELCFRCGKNYNRQTGEETGGRYVQMTDAQIEKYEADLRRLEVENKRRREEAENARHIASLAATGARVVQEPPNYAEPAKGKKKRDEKANR